MNQLTMVHPCSVGRFGARIRVGKKRECEVAGQAGLGMRGVERGGSVRPWAERGEEREAVGQLGRGCHASSIIVQVITPIGC